MKKLVSLLLCFALLLALAACGGDPSSENVNGQTTRDPNMEYGRYVEVDITPEGFEGYMNQIHFGDNGTITMIGMQYGTEENGWVYEYRMYKSTDNGQTWLEDELEWLKPYIVDYEGLDEDNMPETLPTSGGFMILDDGRIMAELGEYNTTTYESDTQYYIINDDGSMEEFNLPGEDRIPEGMDFYVYNAEFLGDNRMFVSYYIYEPYDPDEETGIVIASGGGMENNRIGGIYDLATGELLLDLNDWEGYNVSQNERYLFLQDYYGEYIIVDKASVSRVQGMQLPSQDLIWQINAGSNSYSDNMLVDDEDNFYMISGNGLYKVEPGSEDPEQLLNGMNYTFGSPMAYVYDFYLGEKDDEGRFEFFVQTNIQDQNARLLRYYYDPDAPARGDEVITVFSLVNSSTVKLALSEYSRQHPEVSIDYEFAYEDQYRDQWNEDALTYEDVMTQLNTRLLGGNAPDVIILDDLPLQSYIQKGVLEDISDIVAQTDIIPALAEPLRSDDGSLYAVPTRFSLPMLFGEKGYVEQFTTLEALLAEIESRPGYNNDWDLDNMSEADWDEYYRQREQELPDDEKVAMAFSGIEPVVEMLFATSAPFIYSDADGLNTENLAAMLQDFQRIVNYYGMEGDVWTSYSGGWGFGNGMANYQMESSLGSYMEGQGLLGYSTITTFLALGSASEKNYRYQYIMNDAGIYEAVPPEVTSEANAILAPGLGGYVYIPNLIVGVTTTSQNKELAKDFVASLLSDDVQLYDLGEGFPVTRTGFDGQYESYRTRDRYMAEAGVGYIEPDFDTIFAEGLEPYFLNTYLLDKIKEIAYPISTGELSIDEAVNQIVRETELYFAERQG